MPKLREQTSKFKKMASRIENAFAEQIGKAVAKLGMQSRAEFIRLSIAKRLSIILRQNFKAREVD